MKICSKCNCLKNNFNKYKNAKDGLQSYCADCQKMYTNQFQLATNYNINKLMEKREYLNIVKNNPCEICTKIYPVVCMEFDHIFSNEKLFNIGDYSNFSLNSIKAEIKKCRLLCCFCHRDITHKNFKNADVRVNKLREKINILKAQPCSNCHIKYEPHKMEFNHIIPALKQFNISIMILRHMPFNKIIDEINKCELLCIACHRIKTYHNLDR